MFKPWQQPMRLLPGKSADWNWKWYLNAHLEIYEIDSRSSVELFGKHRRPQKQLLRLLKAYGIDRKEYQLYSVSDAVNALEEVEPGTKQFLSEEEVMCTDPPNPDS